MKVLYPQIQLLTGGKVCPQLTMLGMCPAEGSNVMLCLRQDHASFRAAQLLVPLSWLLNSGGPIDRFGWFYYTEVPGCLVANYATLTNMFPELRDSPEKHPQPGWHPSSRPSNSSEERSPSIQHQSEYLPFQSRQSNADSILI